MNSSLLLFLAAMLLLCATPGAQADDPKPGPFRPGDGQALPGTERLTTSGDLASEMVAGIDRFLLRELERAEARRDAKGAPDASTTEGVQKWLDAMRSRLERVLGLRDARVPFEEMQVVATVGQPATIARNRRIETLAVRWPAFGEVTGEGLLLRPVRGKPKAAVIAIPDASESPEALAGLDGTSNDYAARLAEAGCLVIVPTTIGRQMEKRNNRANLTAREYLYRSAFELGRTLIGYEVLKVQAAADWLRKAHPNLSLGVLGWGEGGRLALFAGAIDSRFAAVCVSGAFGDRKASWREPLDRNVFGLLTDFGDAELAAMVGGRALVVDTSQGPDASFPGEGGAPAELKSPEPEGVRREWSRAMRLAGPRQSKAFVLVEGVPGRAGIGQEALLKFAGALSPATARSLSRKTPASAITLRNREGEAPAEPQPGIGRGLRTGLAGASTSSATASPSQVRQARQIAEIDRHNQKLLLESEGVRDRFMSKLDFTSLAAYEKSAEAYRKVFYEETIGKFEEPFLPLNARTRRAYEAEKWTGYEVVLDVFPEVIAYGILLLPKDLKPGEKRPVVVCQHGLEGRPQHTIGEEGWDAYKGFAARLAERGFVTFAPQNPYIFTDRFRTLQRKANPLGKSLFSVIIPQHRQILEFLKSQLFVDPARIGFYGLSYGGKSAMRIPAALTDYCLSICSADFNEWVWKNASTSSPYSYVWTGEYEIFEWDLGSTFNYAEMAALIAPRPFMVERGHWDGVAPDEKVAHEFARVRRLYNGKLKIGERTEIEFFDGPHTINGKGTFEFLHRQLKW